jgi:hypothetical protein
MKATELKRLIREEVRKVVEETQPQASYKHMKPFKPEIVKMINQLHVLNEKIESNGPLSEEIMDAIGSLEELISRLNIKG